MKKVMCMALLSLICYSAGAQTTDPAAAELAQEQAFQKDLGYTLKLDISDLGNREKDALRADLMQYPPVVMEIRTDNKTDELVFTHNLYLEQETVYGILEKHHLPESAILSYIKNQP